MIIKRLKKQLDYAIEKAGLNENRVLGIFLYGSQNYHMAGPDSDIDSKVIYLPTFEDFCLNKQWLSIDIETEDGEHIDIKDIRYMKEMWEKQNINFLEILFTDYFIINPKYIQLFTHYFKNNREIIAHYDRQKAITSIGGQALHTLSQGTDNKKLYNAHRLYYFLQDYLLDYPYEECIVPTGPYSKSLWELKYHCNLDAEKRLEGAQAVEQGIKHLLEVYKDIDSPYHEAAAATMNKGVCEILKLSFAEKEITKSDFLDSLTNTETKALHSIFNEIHDEGNISLSKMVEKYSISRPVYNNLLSKLKEYNIAEVIAQGVKGTYIRFTQPEIKAEAIDFV